MVNKVGIRQAICNLLDEMGLVYKSSGKDEIHIWPPRSSTPNPADDWEDEFRRPSGRFMFGKHRFLLTTGIRITSFNAHAYIMGYDNINWDEIKQIFEYIKPDMSFSWIPEEMGMKILLDSIRSALKWAFRGEV